MGSEDIAARLQVPEVVAELELVECLRCESDQKSQMQQRKGRQAVKQTVLALSRKLLSFVNVSLRVDLLAEDVHEVNSANLPTLIRDVGFLVRRLYGDTQHEIQMRCQIGLQESVVLPEDLRDDSRMDIEQWIGGLFGRGSDGLPVVRVHSEE